MNKIISRFFVILALVLTCINVHFSNDVDCSGDAHLTPSSPVKTSNSSGSQEDHHCFGLSCNSLMASFSTVEVKSNIVIISQLPFTYKLSTYPEVSISTDKPPAV